LRLSRDGRLLVTSRGIRGVVDGVIAVALSAYLTLLGYSGLRIGTIITGMMLGSAVMTILTGSFGHRFARRTILRVAGLLMVATGLVYATSTTFVVLLVAGVLGTINPTSGDVSMFLPIEQSLLPATGSNTDRTRLFARYGFVGAMGGAIGSLVAGVPEWVAERTSLDVDDAFRTVFVAYAIGGVAILLIYRRLSAAIEPPEHERATKLGPSRRIVYRLAAVFSLDAFAGGFSVQSLVALWLFRRFDMSVGAAGTLLFWMGTCVAVSAFAAPRLAARVGLIRTMAFTHIPAQVFLILAALMPNLPLAIAFLILRSLLSTMDAPARSSYVMAVVSPPERAAAASITNVPRSLAAALPPIAAGWMLDRSDFGWPLILAGGLKIVYDLILLAMFRNVRPPEEQPAEVVSPAAR